jgi:hypothetical protein
MSANWGSPAVLKNLSAGPDLTDSVEKLDVEHDGVRVSDPTLDG